jgi:hypothetical protein
MSLAAVKTNSKWLHDQHWNRVSAVAEWKKPISTPQSCVKRGSGAQWLLRCVQFDAKWKKWSRVESGSEIPGRRVGKQNLKRRGQQEERKGLVRTAKNQSL